MADQNGSVQSDGKRELIQVGGMDGDLHPHANYLIDGSLYSSFAIGNVGDADDFFLVGSPPHDGTEYPLLTGNVLDSQGEVLFRLVRNELTFNPRRCTKTPGSRMGYKIHNSRGETVLRVRTTYEMVAFQRLQTSVGMCVTRLAGEFFDKGRNLVYDARAAKNGLSGGIGSALNWRGGQVFGVVKGYDDDQRAAAAAAIATRGAIHEVVRGLVEEETVDLDGKLLLGADLRNCRIVVRTGDFVVSPDSSITQCAFDFQDNARRIATLVLSTMPQDDSAATATPEES
jgi:hypothetical protein